MDLNRLEIELKKRWSYPYHWGNKQNNDLDKATNFIYKTYSFESLLKRTEYYDSPLKNYAFNRWYNFWSAMAAENIFTTHSNVEANKNKKDKLIDFKINNIPFDHKTSIFPFGFNKSYSFARKNEKQLIQWFYDNQSQQGRKHLKNRLFIVVYDDRAKEHWKMKAEIRLIKSAIDEYIENFSVKNLYTFDFGEGEIFSDIIWLTK
ncbi:MAG: hypothetical protein J7J72_07050 [Bacteroidales bacterium]|nr:hypothetical protein [Bacteroidales bacterium]